MEEKFERLLEVSVVARRLNVSTDTIRRMLKDPGHPLQGVRVGRKCFRVLERSIQSAIEARRMAAEVNG